MFFHQRFIPGLAIASYMVGDEKAKSVAVIDPTRDVDEYLRIAKEQGLHITHILETHVHADYVSGSAELKARIERRWPLRALDPNYRGEVAQRYAFEDGAGEIGFISSVSQPFCGDCTRGRLSADGKLYTCLFALTGHDIRSALRAGASETSP